MDLAQYEPLVVSIVHKFSPKDQDTFNELKQVGTIALWKSFNGYQPQKAAFSTYAWKCIYNAVLLSATRNSPVDSRCLVDGVVVYSDTFEEFLPDKLTQMERDSILRRREGYTFREIGEIYGISPRHIKTIVDRAIVKIRKANL